jgi:hypothetical protein
MKKPCLQSLFVVTLRESTCHHTLLINLSQCGICGLKMAQTTVNIHARHLDGWRPNHLLIGLNFLSNVLIAMVKNIIKTN